MAKQLIYEGCGGNDAALVSWNSQNPSAPNTYKTEFTPIRVFLHSPEQRGDFNLYQSYHLYFFYRREDYHYVDGVPEPIWIDQDNEGNRLFEDPIVDGAPGIPELRFDRTTPQGVDVYFWAVLVQGYRYEYDYNEVTEQFEQVDIYFEEYRDFLAWSQTPLPRGKSYGRTEILEAYALDSDGNRLSLGGGFSSDTWKLTVEGTVGGTFEETFSQTFPNKPENVYVDCDQCSNDCLKVMSNDRKRFTCVCREIGE